MTSDGSTAEQPSGNLEKLNLTNDELSRISEAMKNPEFMSLLKDYMEELKENRDVYEQEITALEAERGNDITWIRPSPAEFVVKTHRLPQEQQQESEPNKEPSKVFINMCHSMEIDQPSMKLVDNRQLWSVPFSLSKPREDFDKAGKRCLVYDCVFNPDSFEKARLRPAFRQLLVQTAIEGIENQFHCLLDKKYSIPKMKSKGEPAATVLRKPTASKPSSVTTGSPDELKDVDDRTRSLLQQFEEMKMNPGKKSADIPPPLPSAASTAVDKRTKLIEELPSAENSSPAGKSDLIVVPPQQKGPETPIYQIVHRGEFDMSNYVNNRNQSTKPAPKELIVRIEVPRVKSLADMQLDTDQRRLSFSVPDIYELTVDLPYAVDSSRGSAKFDKSTGRLTIVLPVVLSS